ncbi:leucine-rich repeat extensin-like protein 7 [Iris pallida]|uniref:Leucine-rich repeat extensin-like protein 7 n=1 Tax=Iris pallida TaxID=29817 RepID=A0AAX6FZ40_IRIPA|nr:leucine-rich repeat extensin-like protein 7 [Iris pallida]
MLLPSIRHHHRATTPPATITKTQKPVPCPDPCVRVQTSYSISHYSYIKHFRVRNTRHATPSHHQQITYLVVDAARPAALLHGQRLGEHRSLRPADQPSAPLCGV